jgi:hypothetical protein
MKKEKEPKGFPKSATHTSTVVQHVLNQHSKELYDQKKHVCDFGCKAGHIDQYFLWKHNTTEKCKGKAKRQAEAPTVKSQVNDSPASTNIYPEVHQ